MKIGILADIHEHVEHLQSAVKIFRQKDVDQVILLGDIFETGKRINETVKILRDVNAVGVWGNHELGLCHEPEPEIAERYGTHIIEFFETLKPHFECENILFSHGIPTWDATDPAIYYSGDSPWEPGSLLPVFAGFPHQLFLIGHYHQWLMATANRSISWDRMNPIVLDPDVRHFLIINAVFLGWCATLNTETNELTPHFVG